MTDVVCVRVRLKEGSLPRAREWAREIAGRESEALDTLASEGVSIESVFLDSSTEGDFLIYYMRARSIGQASKVAATSVAAIDQFHQTFKREVWVDVRKLELLLDLQQKQT